MERSALRRQGLRLRSMAHRLTRSTGRPNISASFNSISAESSLDLRALRREWFQSLARAPNYFYNHGMTGLEIIKEIRRLPVQEQEKVAPSVGRRSDRVKCLRFNRFNREMNSNGHE